MSNAPRPNHRQLPLFSQAPATPQDISRATPLKATFDLFAQALTADGKSDHTVAAFAADLDLLAEYQGEATPIGDITLADLTGFFHWMDNERDVPCSRKTYARRMTTVKAFFRWLHDDVKALRADPAKALVQRSGPAPLSDVLSPAQLRDCLEASRTFKYKRSQTPDTRPELLLRLLVDTGIKKNEAMLLTPASIITDDPRQPVVQVRYKVRSVFKERNIDLKPDWLRLYDEYLRQYTPSNVLFDCTPRNLEYVLSDIGEVAALPFKLSFEICRWTCGLRDLRAGLPDEFIRSKLGLSDVSWYETGGKLRQLDERLRQRGD
ncbi:MAG: site-specific integrase [Anaerolineae bacterium]|jgi:integrase/recombinase XerD|nr:site-specific integrase [Anaerolineae bacterium]